MRSRTLQTELIQYHLDSDGHVTYDEEPDYNEESDSVEDGYQCLGCGWQGHELEEEVVPEDCECDECVEPDVEEEGPDPDRIIAIVRNFDRKFAIDPNWPRELIQLANDRTTHFLPVPRWRATEIHDEHLRECPDFSFDFSEISESVIAELMYDYSDQPELPKEANDGNVPACA